VPDFFALGDKHVLISSRNKTWWHIFIDRSVIETFANERMGLTQRFYPQREDCLPVGLFASGSAQIKSVDVWELAV
jgi:sucrose-6-phosphate hydrolase SacC (GH32 family)